MSFWEGWNASSQQRSVRRNGARARLRLGGLRAGCEQRYRVSSRLRFRLPGWAPSWRKRCALRSALERQEPRLARTQGGLRERLPRWLPDRLSTGIPGARLVQPGLSGSERSEWAVWPRRARPGRLRAVPGWALSE